MLTEDFEQAQGLSAQVEQARQRAVLAASDAGASRDDARAAEQQAREYARGVGQVVDGAERARDEAEAAADRAEAPTDSMVATLAGNPVSLTRAAVDQATGDMINTGGSTTQAAGDARWVTQTGADILVASEIERTGSETQVSGDNRWVTNAGADSLVSALFSAPGSSVQATADARYSKRGELEFNVRDYGAVGNGTVDDTAGVQAAIDACCTAGGGRVVVPPSTFNAPYRVGRLWIWADDVTFEVMPGVRMMRKGGTWGLGNRDGRDTSRMPLKDLNDPYSGPSNITVVGGVWDGAVNDEAYVPDGFNCHMFNSCRNITFRDMTIKDIVTNHALDMNGVDGMLVENCKFFGYKDATTDQSRNYTEAIQLSTMNADPESMGGFPLYSNGAATRGVRIIDCEFGPSGSMGTQSWPTAFGNHSAINRSRDGLLTGDIIARGNKFNGMTHIAVTIYTWDDVTLDGNIFTSCKAGVQANNFTQSRRWNPATKVYDVAPSRENCYNIKVVNNTFMNSEQFDVTISGTGISGVDGAWGTFRNVNVSNNTRIRTLSGRSSASFIRLLLCQDSVISGNIGGHSSVGIAAQGCQRIQINGNYIENTNTYGILCDATGAITTGAFNPIEAQVVSNVVESAGSHSIGVNSYAGFAVIGNKSKNHSRSNGGAGIIFSGSSDGLISTNDIKCTSQPNTANGIQGTLASSNVRITLDNRIEGVTNRLLTIAEANGVIYGNIEYV